MSGWGAAIAAGTNAFIGDKAAKKAAKNQLKSVRESNALQRYLFEQGRADQQPYREAGYGALGQMSRVMGLGRINTTPAQWSYDGKRGVSQVGGQGQGLGGYGAESYGVLGGMSPEFLASIGYSQPQQPMQQQMPVEEDRYGGFYASPGYQFAYVLPLPVGISRLPMVDRLVASARKWRDIHRAWRAKSSGITSIA